MPLRATQAKSKDAVFNEITKKYGKYERVGPKAEDKPRYWEVTYFKFVPPTDDWIGDLKPIGAVDVSLVFAGDPVKNKGQYNVYLSSKTMADEDTEVPVGTIQETYK